MKACTKPEEMPSARGQEAAARRAAVDGILLVKKARALEVTHLRLVAERSPAAIARLGASVGALVR